VHETMKIEEAAYFLSRMNAERENRAHFRYEFSAFLSAARSVLQLALEQVKTTAGGPAWYQAAIARDPLFSTFKNLRDTNIHERPVQPPVIHTVVASDYIHLHDEGEEGRVIPHSHVTNERRYTLEGWSGPESVEELSAKYLESLKTLVADGVTIGMLPPPCVA
jgi:hypothetical protein